MTTARFLPLALAVPVRELLLELAKSADVDPADFETLTVLDFQRLVALARDAACERPTLSSIPAAEEPAAAFIEMGLV